jgi:hypothetical protein
MTTLLIPPSITLRHRQPYQRSIGSSTNLMGNCTAGHFAEHDFLDDKNFQAKGCERVIKIISVEFKSLLTSCNYFTQ